MEDQKKYVLIENHVSRIRRQKKAMKPQASLKKKEVKRRLYLRSRTQDQKKHVQFENHDSRIRRQVKD